MTNLASNPSKIRVILAGLIGNVMEWYDFALYGCFAPVIGSHFFPSKEPSVSLIATFGVFAVGVMMRPLGGLLFGRIGDLLGRQRAMILSIMAMAMPTVLFGLLPTYSMVGIAAPIAVVLLRMVQGLSVGGEYTNSLVFLAEQAQPDNRARTAVWGIWGAMAGILLGSAVGTLISNLLTSDQLANWGWRLPFLLGSVVAFVGYLLRNGMHVIVRTSESKAPVRDTFVKYYRPVLIVTLLNVALGVGFHAAFVYAVTYVQVIDHIPETVALDFNTASMAMMLVMLPIAAWFSDRFGRKPLLILGSGLFAFGGVGFFHLLHSADRAVTFAGEFGFAAAISIISGGLAGANVELIPSAVRCTGLALAYNVATGLLGGTTPLISAWLITSTENPIAPGWWVSVMGAVSLVTAIFLVRETRFDPLQ